MSGSGRAGEADRTLFVGNLDPKVTEELIFELFHQVGAAARRPLYSVWWGGARRAASRRHSRAGPGWVRWLRADKLPPGAERRPRVGSAPHVRPQTSPGQPKTDSGIEFTLSSLLVTPS